jgi:cathepsin H
MYKSFSAIALLLSSASAFQAKNTNTLFSAQLNGEKQMTHEHFEMMFRFFESEFESPNKGVKSLDHRKIAFADSIERIIEHNSQEGVAFKKAINSFSDMTDEEFTAHFNLKQIQEDQHCSATSRDSIEALGEVPSEWNWREHSGVSPVKNQGHCGSCWTFSTVGALEAHTMIKYDGVTDFYAEQQLVDCAQAFDNHGCEGGLPSHAFEYVKYAGGISTESAYPYTAKDETCTVKSDTFALSVPQGSFNIT